MKKFLLVLMLVLPMAIWAQEKHYKTNNDGSVTFERILKAENKRSEEHTSELQSQR